MLVVLPPGGWNLHCSVFTAGRVFLNSSLSSVCNLSHNGSRLVEMDDDIIKQVDSAQQEASAAQLSASLALNMVRRTKSGDASQTNQEQFFTSLSVCVFQTVHSEGSLSEEGRTKLNISRTVWVQSQQVNQTAEGQLGGGGSGWGLGWVESVGDDVATCWWSLDASSFRAATQHLGRHKESGCGQRWCAQPYCPPASANHSPTPHDQW